MAVDPHTEPHFAASALLTIDLQVDFLDGGASPVEGTTAILPASRRVVDSFRAAERPIVHVVRLYLADGSNADLCRKKVAATDPGLVRPGTPGSQLAATLFDTAPDLDTERLLCGLLQEIGPSEWVLYKPRWNAFYATPLERWLVGRGVDTVVITGCNYPNCPRGTIFGASERDFRIVAVNTAISRLTREAPTEMAGLGVAVLDDDQVVTAIADRARRRP